MSGALPKHDPESTLRFEGFELRRDERVLLRHGGVVPLRSKAFDLLLVLVERAGHLVTKDEILDAVWQGRVVEENNIAAQITALRKGLGGDLIATVPGYGYRFIGTVMSEAPELVPVMAPAVAPIRPQPLLFGRVQDTARVSAALADPGCVTLVGPAGVGKTTLAKALVSAAAGKTGWVDLASLTNGEQILPSLGRILGVPQGPGDPWDALAVALRPATLLVLDNAEHLVDPVAVIVARLLASVPGLRLLVTSQVPLAIEGERTERLDPLSLPDEAANEPEAVPAAALAMFIDRVHAADSRFEFSTEGLVLARRLCVELDGMPLAIEMAAARVPLLGLEQVQRALAERFVALRHHKRDAPARHRTLQTALDWSYGLLTEPEKGLLRALGVCAGGFTTELAVALMDADRWETIELLGALIDRSLVVSSHEDPPRHRLLETVRAYALGRLRAAGEETAVRVRHAELLTELFRVAHDAVSGPDNVVYQRATLAEVENARVALDWAMREAPGTAVRLSAYVARATSTTGWRTEAYGWLAACEPLLRAPELAGGARAVWARQFAAQSLFFGDPRALDRAREAVMVCRAADEPLHLAYALIYMARAFKGPDRELQAVLAEVAALIDGHPDWGADLRALHLNCKGHAAELDGDIAQAIESWRAALAIARDARLRLATTLSSFNIARALHRLGRQGEAIDVLDRVIVPGAETSDVTMMQCEVLKLSIDLEHLEWPARSAECGRILTIAQRLGSLDMLDVLAPGLVRAGRPRAAALLIGLIRRVRDMRGANVGATRSADLRAASEQAARSLGAVAYGLLVERGGELSDSVALQILQADD